MKFSEIVLGGLLFVLFVVHVLGLLDQSMMFSGMLVTLLCVFIGLVWQEKVQDERDEYIRTKTDRYMYLFTLALLAAVITYKTFLHLDYYYELLFVAVLSVGKLLLSKIIREQN